jgi:hypothetical protein
MRLALNISYDIEDVDAEAEDILAAIVTDEARGFASTVTERLRHEGVSIENVSVTETQP